MTARPSRRRSRGRTPAEGEPRVPLWREAIAVQAELRETVPPRAATRERIPFVHLAGGTVLLAGSAVVASLVIYRRGVVLARLQRPPQLRGQAIAGLPRFVRPRIVADAWQQSATAFGLALVVWLLCAALPRWRRVGIRWGWIPALGAVAGFLAFTLRSMPLPN